MKINDIIMEGRDAALFHAFQYPNYAAQALKTNKLLATSSQRFWPDGKRRKDNEPDYQSSYWMKGVSLTRDKKFAMEWGNIVLTLDQAKLANRYKIEPFNWFYSIPNSQSRKREREEYLIVKRTPDTYMDKHPDDPDGEATFNTKRFTRPEGAVENLNQYLLGIQMDHGMIEIFGRDHEDIQTIINHKKFIGFYKK